MLGSVNVMLMNAYNCNNKSNICMITKTAKTTSMSVYHFAIEQSEVKYGKWKKIDTIQYTTGHFCTK